MRIPYSLLQQICNDVYMNHSKKNWKDKNIDADLKHENNKIYIDFYNELSNSYEEMYRQLVADHNAKMANSKFNAEQLMKTKNKYREGIESALLALKAAPDLTTVADAVDILTRALKL